MVDPHEIHRDGITRGRAYLHALARPLEKLLQLDGMKKPIQVSLERGELMVISHKRNVDNLPIVVVANTHALTGANSPAYVDESHAPHIAEIMSIDREAYSLRMGVYTKEDDTLVVESKNPTGTKTAYAAIRDSFEAIGIYLARDITIVDSVGKYVASLAGTVPILPTFIEPSYLATFGKTEEEAAMLFEEGLRNVAGYTKNGAEQLWRHFGIPTPPTQYFSLVNYNKTDVARRILEDFPSYDRFVINTHDGAGGDGIRMPDIFGLEEELIDFEDRDIQVQGWLPLEESPCVIANLTDRGVDIKMVSRQRVINGAHAGNEWVRPDIEDRPLSDEFWRINKAALEVLRKSGIRGQVNVDSLVISEETRKHFGLSSCILMREANIRPAASSAILRIRQGNINGEPITRVHTQAGIALSLKDFIRPEFQQLLKSGLQEGMAAVAFNFDLHTSDPLKQKVSLAFCGVASTTSNQLHDFETKIQQAITQKSFIRRRKSIK